MELKKEIIATTDYLFTNQLIWGNSGNLSARIDEENYLITRSGSYLADLKNSDLISWKIDKKADPDLAIRPSKEYPMHEAIYTERPEINAVIHASPFYGTLAASSDLKISQDHFVEAMYYLERIEYVDYAHPGSEKLAELVREKAGKTNIMILKNHGVLVFDTSLIEAKMALHTLEFACKMATFQQKIQPLSPETVQDFLDNAGYKKRRQW